MVDWLKSRFKHVAALVRQKALSRWLALFTFLHTVFSLWREDFASTAQQEKLRAVTFLPDWPLSWWIAIFLGVLVIWMFEASHRMHRSFHDAFAHGLVVETVQPSLDAGNATNTLELRLLLRNTTAFPMKFAVEHYAFEVGGFKVITTGTPAIIPPQNTLTFFPIRGLSKKEHAGLPARSAGGLRLLIVYGHPDGSYTRRTKRVLEVHVFKKKNGKEVRVNWMQREGSDDPI
jgi:hypothetical protein